MKQATASFWYAGDDGRDVFVKAGAVRSDEHPEVKRAPDNFTDIAVDDPAPKKPAARKAAAGNA